MKELPTSTDRQKQPTNPGYAVSSPASFKKRTLKAMPGALLFLALIGVIAYAPASTEQTSENTNKQTITEQPQPQERTTTAEEASNAQDPAGASVKTESKVQNSVSGGVSTNITTTNGKTTVTVNGEPVATPQDGPVSKTVTTDNGNTVRIDVSQNNANTGSSNVNSFSNSSSNYWSFNSGTTNMTGGY